MTAVLSVPCNTRRTGVKYAMQRGRASIDARSRLIRRNVVAAGMRTSMRLEQAMWDALHEIAGHEETSINELVARIGRSSADRLTRTSAVRVFIINFYRDRLRSAAPWLFGPTLVHSGVEKGFPSGC
jgi:predicted DNA-binding ribbon-helix-helix protein